MRPISAAKRGYGLISHKNYEVQWYIRTILYCMSYALMSVCVFITIPAGAQRYPFHNLSVDDGLLQSQATCLAQDKTGNLWIGTLGGLSRYDGKTFTNYTVRNGLMNNVVWAVAVDTQGNIWVGDQSGLSQFDGKKFVHYPKPQQMMTASIIIAANTNSE